MLKVVARNFQSNESKIDSSNKSPLKMEKKSSCSSVSVDTRYWDLSDKYLSASEILSDKTDAWTKAYKEYQDARAQVKRIYEEMKNIESLVTKI